jgi:hypothetical protein
MPPESPQPSVKALVKALGGANAVARACGVVAAAVSNWGAVGAIPHRHHATLWRLAQAKGVAWTPPGFEGVRLVAVVDPHFDDASATAAPAVRENPVKLDDAA